ncbi:hypothetical protein TVAG_326240 [Trichomonas vaginalis G3]|uniref:Uncharacterized protein n=1 Tax=Trichomonas vaginalis (strain ATCC PRA-98 / G3) TaxID=412133 RepID=A2GC61_TRIV3|nr:hypothetical protein TVAGG3_0612390 [Trichomonas vaginalis G3]EAX85256.1 hypothetical protein TVAG_326240 [Trichomonas vaginalis G3]KAI5503291.1 hypothetical protein TVAGG3_0612390 [Trichomonas vaginalis G3]|eukprot:XP_001298186.1 hypothetical protein [Trichomonas vaginalis G3]
MQHDWMQISFWKLNIRHSISDLLMLNGKYANELFPNAPKTSPSKMTLLRLCFGGNKIRNRTFPQQSNKTNDVENKTPVNKFFEQLIEIGFSSSWIECRTIILQSK